MAKRILPKPMRPDEGDIAKISPSLKGYIRGQVDSREDAEDIFQDVMASLFETVEYGRDEIENLPAWLFRVARNAVLNLIRKKKPEKLPEMAEPIFDGGPSPEDEQLRTLFWNELWDALDSLPEAQRQTWVLSELDGLPVREIAAIMGEKEATVLSRKHYAVKVLRRRMKALYDEIINS